MWCCLPSGLVPWRLAITFITFALTITFTTNMVVMVKADICYQININSSPQNVFLSAINQTVFGAPTASATVSGSLDLLFSSSVPNSTSLGLLRLLFIVYRLSFVVCWLLIVDCCVYCLSFIVCWLLIVDCWLLIVDCWLLIVDCWLLIVDCWLCHAFMFWCLAPSIRLWRTTINCNCAIRGKWDIWNSCSPLFKSMYK